MSELHYTDEEKIKRLTAWHESEKAEIEQLKSTISNLTAFNESMQTDARKNTETIRKQAAEIAQLKEKVRYAYVQIEALERAK